MTEDNYFHFGVTKALDAYGTNEDNCCVLSFNNIIRGINISTILVLNISIRNYWNSRQDTFIQIQHFNSINNWSNMLFYIFTIFML